MLLKKYDLGYEKPFFKVRPVMQNYFAILEKGKVGEIRTIIVAHSTEGQNRCYIRVGFVYLIKEKCRHEF